MMQQIRAKLFTDCLVWVCLVTLRTRSSEVTKITGTDYTETVTCEEESLRHLEPTSTMMVSEPTY